MTYRLALDIGTNSIGWSILELNEKASPVAIIDGGVRIFADGRDPKKNTSLAATRREARQRRRRRDRFVKRRNKLMRALIRHDLMPENGEERKALEKLDPYELRYRGLHQRLTLHEFGRALFHINQRRGFKSNRKVSRDKDAPKIKPAIERLKEQMGQMSYGEYLYFRRQQGLHVRARKHGEGANANYDIYPERSLVEDEFNRLWKAQEVYHSSLTPEVRDKIHNIIFYQRPLKPVTPGRCTLEPSEYRCPRALPLAQLFRILQELNHLQVVLPNLSTRPLSKDERDKLLLRLLKNKTLSFSSMRKELGLPGDTSFNLEGEKRENLTGDETGAMIKKVINKTKWFQMAPDKQNELVKLLLDEEDEDDLLAGLTQDWGFTLEEAMGLAALDLPQGYARLSEKALKAIVPQLEAEVIPYSEAVVRAGYQSHSDLGDKEILKRLPYYGVILDRHVTFGSDDPRDPLAKRFGQVPNPTVHIALNQLRRVVNELIKLHGHPAEIVVEVSRDLKNGPRARKRIEKEQKANQERNKRHREKLRELGISERGDGVLRLRLWEELNENPAARCCPYSGRPISIENLFSGEVEIEHILPFSRTLDDSIANKTVCLRQANRDKGNRTPFEAFGNSPQGYDWQAITARASKMPRNKRWRFAEDAMERFEKNGDFLARQLTDNQYIARLAREYLTAICPANKVWVTPGRLTYLLGRRWGFPAKNRDDHRHHALDAILIGVTDRALLKRVAETHQRDQSQAKRFLASLDQPWPGFREEALAVIERIIVSHRPDHGIQGQLHNETAYALRQGDGKNRNAEHRVPVAYFKKVDSILKIKGRRLRAELLSYVSGKPLSECRRVLTEADTTSQKEAKKAVKEFSGIGDKYFKEKASTFFSRRGIRGVRICETETLIPIKDAQGKPYKWVKGDSNAYYDIYLSPDGTWVGEIVSTFDANQVGYRTEYEDKEGYQRIIRLFRNDMLEIEHEGERVITYVVKLSEKQIALAPHNEANVDKRNRDKENHFSMIRKASPAALQNAGARPVYVSPAGRVIYLKVPRHVTERS